MSEWDKIDVKEFDETGAAIVPFNDWSHYRELVIRWSVPVQLSEPIVFRTALIQSVARSLPHPIQETTR